ncbi:MAG: HAMP domain-containing histidine kinase, partial [Melioribacteraceae bacterium]|nr:HAMP domain-containing histidine kinase [Melioribacteraceae bacterium]
QMDSLIGVIIISLLFILLSGLAYFLIKNNVFESKRRAETDQLKLDKGDKLKILAKLKNENVNLNSEIRFLEEKNRRLRLKIDQMKKVILHLEDQKAQLEISERKLKDLRIQKDETLAIVAHDIKNPASAIKSFVDLLESYDLSAQEQHDVFSGLVETSSRLLKLADEFTSVIAEEYTPFQIKKEKHNIKDAIEKIVNVNRVKANDKNIELRLYQPEQEINFDFDEEKIKEVVDNLVGNAIKFCPEKTKVEIFTKYDQKYVIVEITDNGFGLTEDEVAQAFEKGSKLSTKPTGNETSSGLGLWIAKKIVTEHDGKIWVKSKKGFGSTFAFKLPLK